MPKTANRARRTPEERIAELQKRIEDIKHRAERAKAKKSPALRYMNAALRSIEKAQGETDDAATRKALDEVRATLAAALALNGVTAGRAPASRSGGGRRSSGDVEDLADRLLEHLRSHPNQRGEEIADALGTDTHTMRLPMKKLIEAKRVKTSGRNRGTRYSLA